MTMASSVKIRDMVLAAMFAAMLCVISPFTIQVGPIPLTLATFAIYLAPSVLGWRRGCVAVLVYLLIGAVGVPVFSNFTGGVQKFVSSTGGYLVGYLPCAFFAGFVTYMLKKKVWANVLGMVIGTIVLYTLGTAWFVISSGATLQYAWTVCILPFLPGDAIKIILVAVIAPPLRIVAEKR